MKYSRSAGQQLFAAVVVVSDEQQEQDPTNLYISNLPVTMDEQDLESMLKPFGHVISTRILRDASGVSRGVGFARMESTEKCEVVIQHFNGKYLKTPPAIPVVIAALINRLAAHRNMHYSSMKAFITVNVCRPYCSKSLQKSTLFIL
ncbi:hypothetical protein MHYP_G00169530 [Metynnis hypsauchen]